MFSCLLLFIYDVWAEIMMYVNKLSVDHCDLPSVICLFVWSPMSSACLALPLSSADSNVFRLNDGMNLMQVQAVYQKIGISF